MHARAVAATTTALLGSIAVLFPADGAAADGEGAAASPLVLAHRGACAHAPENTLAAVDRAAELGVEWVENDVQRTKDGELVVVHDDVLRRTTDVEQVFPGRAPWRVGDFTAAEIARLDAGSWFGSDHAGARVPTLTEFLRRLDHHGQKLLLELKRPELYPGIERETLRVLADEGWLDEEHLADRLIVQSFDLDSLRTLHGIGPGMRTGFLGTPSLAQVRDHARFVDQVNPSHESLTADYVRAVRSITGAHGRPLEVFTWTVDDAATARKVAAYGVDGVITDRPDVVRDALARQ
ncbi:glycerophosphodiester phosphodiesterase [Streptomyces sp. NPDC089424]|uniref:glycerophosphodiester phosphodiesterase n=1 Tax=Streptomyces sp. NPDC089424 TaxID=3365917 RepID=UPI00381858BD